jgi:REP element-mobilizing transposase RayT
MPDRPQGYVRRGQGILPQDMQMAILYRKNAQHAMVEFQDEHQRTAINTVIAAVTHIDCRLLFVATDPTHVHALLSWQGQKTWHQKRTSLKRALTIHFKERFGNRPWFADGASRKRVKDRKHFDYLMTRYLPRHNGWKWDETRGLFK